MQHVDTETVNTAPSATREDIIRRLGDVFGAAGETLFLVGGAVRDALLGNAAQSDLDFATSALPARTVQILESLDVSRPYRVGEKFGTIGVWIGPWRAEVTTYRSAEVYLPGSRKPEVTFGKTLLEDLSRRDFTINAMAQDARTGELLDPLGGQNDLTAGIIRAVGNAPDRFREDPLRMLRAIRFASRFRFTIEEATWNAVHASAALLDTISRERVQEEYTRMLESCNPVEALTLLRDSSLLQHSVPDLLTLTTMTDHGPRHPLSLWDHTMNVVAGVRPDLVLRWAALLHDIGKPATRTHEPSGRPRFFHHEEVGATIAREILTGLRYSNDIINKVTLLVETHMQIHAYSPEWSDGAVRRFMLRLGPLTDAAIQLARADAAGHTSGTPANAPKFDELEARIRSLDQEAVRKLESPLTGTDLMQRYNRPPGPWIREVKQALLEAVLDGSLTPEDRTGAWRIADDLVGQA